MASSQASYASRLARAEQLFQHINSFADYNPGIPELTPVSLQDLIAELSTTQSQHTITHYEYAEVAKERKKIFITNSNSISRRLTLANSYLRAKQGTESQEYIDVNTFIQKIRGNRPITVTINTNEETISRSERSFGSQLQNFTDVITLLARYNTIYQPSNVTISITELQTLLAEATIINNKVTINYGAFKPKINERQNGFKTLAETATRIKEMVKAQYGNNSIEYNLIRKLRFS